MGFNLVFKKIRFNSENRDLFYFFKIKIIVMGSVVWQSTTTKIVLFFGFNYVC